MDITAAGNKERKIFRSVEEFAQAYLPGVAAEQRASARKPCLGIVASLTDEALQNARNTARETGN
jgi:hypothetical protein